LLNETRDSSDVLSRGIPNLTPKELHSHGHSTHPYATAHHNPV